MAKRPRTPSEIKEASTKETASFTLDPSILMQVKMMAASAGTSASAIVEEALRFYIETVKEKK